MGESDDFEWADRKNAITLQNREFELYSAARMFDGRGRFETISPKSPYYERRFITMAEVDGRVLFCVWTWRGNKRRIISSRAAHRSERVAYKEATRSGR